MRRKTILLGEAPAKTMSGKGVPAFSSASGRRLTSLLGQDVRSVFEVHNLLSEWPGKAAKGSQFPRELGRQAARSFWRSLPDGSRVIVAGRRVAKASGIPHVPYLRWFTLLMVDVKEVKFAILPHPTGVNQWYNDPSNVEKAREFLRREARRLT